MPEGEWEFYRKISLEECKTTCDEDSYCNYFMYNLSTSSCKTFHEKIESNEHKEEGKEESRDNYVKQSLFCKRSKLIIIIDSLISN